METLQHRFVEFIPEALEEGILYITMEYRTAVHKCICGCGNEVITPFSPTDWHLRFYGDSISIFPSIGSWGFKCRSHYWIIKNRIEHAGSWDDKEIQQGRKIDKENKEKYYDQKSEHPTIEESQKEMVKKRRKWSFKQLFSFFGFK
ncbi:DUF6527 family protein [Pedobacter sp.]|uniref:DUF6527 family protein n=1 Tax=Pedobacter sp. TaxID=1411316 RepID=UPI003BAB0A1B